MKGNTNKVVGYKCNVYEDGINYAFYLAKVEERKKDSENYIGNYNKQALFGVFIGFDVMSSFTLLLKPSFFSRL